MFNYVLIEPSFENCTLVEYVFEGIESVGLEVSGMTVINANRFKVSFNEVDFYIFVSTSDSFTTIKFEILDNNDKLLDVVTLGTFDDASTISSILLNYKINCSNNSYKNIGVATPSQVIDIIDEETDVKSTSWRTKGVMSVDEPESIVPDTVLDCRVVALVYDNNTIAYRFKTNVGSFDMNREVAKSYGLAPDKVSKFTRLLLVNDIFMTKGEHEAGRLIPDISNSKVDCDKLFSALFKGGIG